MFDRIKRGFISFCHTIRAGYYKPITGAEDIDIESGPDSPSTQLPAKNIVSVGVGALAVAYAVVTDIALGIATAASTTVVSLGAGIVAVTGLTVLGHIYRKCKNACADVITEKNAADQTVRGTREDLYTLHQAQKKIFSLTAEFAQAAPMSVIEKEVEVILEKTELARKRIKVLDKKGAVQPAQEYIFKRIVMDFADVAASRPKNPGARHQKKNFKPQLGHAA